MKKIYLLVLFISSAKSFASVTEGIYLGINGGLTNNIVTYNTSTYTEQATGSQLYNANVGYNLGVDIGYNFNKYNGLEFGGNYLSQTTSELPGNTGNLSTAATAISISYILNLPTLIKDLAVFGRLGIAYDSVNQGITSQSNCNCSNNSIGSSAQGANFADILGAGLRYKLSGHSTVKIEWVANGLLFPIGINQGNSNVANWYSQNFNVGYNYHF